MPESNRDRDKRFFRLAGARKANAAFRGSAEEWHHQHRSLDVRHMIEQRYTAKGKKPKTGELRAFIRQDESLTAHQWGGVPASDTAAYLNFLWGQLSEAVHGNKLTYIIELESVEAYLRNLPTRTWPTSQTGQTQASASPNRRRSTSCPGKVVSSSLGVNGPAHAAQGRGHCSRGGQGGRNGGRGRGSGGGRNGSQAAPSHRSPSPFNAKARRARSCPPGPPPPQATRMQISVPGPPRNGDGADVGAVGGESENEFEGSDDRDLHGAARASSDRTEASITPLTSGYAEENQHGEALTEGAEGAAEWSSDANQIQGTSELQGAASDNAMSQGDVVFPSFEKCALENGSRTPLDRVVDDCSGAQIERLIDLQGVTVRCAESCRLDHVLVFQVDGATVINGTIALASNAWLSITSTRFKAENVTFRGGGVRVQGEPGRECCAVFTDCRLEECALTVLDCAALTVWSSHSVNSPGAALAVSGPSAKADLTNFEAYEARRAGLACACGAEVIARQCKFEKCRSDGVVVRSGAKARLTESSMLFNGGDAVSLFSVGSYLHAADCTMSHNTGGVLVYGGASATAERCRFRDNLFHGVSVSAGGEAVLLHCGGGGSTTLYGLVVSDAGSSAKAVACAFDSAAVIGIAVVRGARARLESCDSCGASRFGLAVEGEGSFVDASGCVFDDNWVSGVSVSEGAEARLEGCTGKGPGRKRGLQVGDGASVTAEHCTFDREETASSKPRTLI